MPVNVSNQNLFVKSYFASSVDEGMAQARADLGPDALLLNTREAPPEARHLGDYEVVFGMTSDVARSSTTGDDATEDLRRRVEEIHELVARMAKPNLLPAGGTALLEASLLDAGVDEDMIQEISQSVRQRARTHAPVQIGQRHHAEPDPETMRLLALEEIGSRFDVSPTLERITALVGPPGSGKTTTIVKLAVAQGLATGRPVHLLSTDHYRIAAVEQMRTYAVILGVPFQSCETTVALAHAISAAPDNALVLVDTPGYSRADLESAGDVAAFLSERQDIDTHLVLTASMRQRDQRRIADSFEIFRPSKLLFTRLDETDAYGSMFCEASRRKLPISFVAAGQLIPEDLAPASKQLITESLAHELPKAVRAVA